MSRIEKEESFWLRSIDKIFYKNESVVVYIVRGKVQQKPFAGRDIE